MKTILICILTLLAVVGCGGGSKTTGPSPTPTPAPVPIPAASIVISGQAAFGLCLAGSCFLNASIQNVGVGCATSTTVVARLYNTGGAQVGSDIQMGGSGASLSARVIRPQEIVALSSVAVVASPFPSQASSIRLFPSWNDVRC